jgi:adenosylcobinamide hydrolase
MKKRQAASLRTSYRVSHRTLVIDLGYARRVLSSAPQGGGLRTIRYILNHQVEANPLSRQRTASTQSPRRDRWDDPARYLRRLAAALGADRDSVGLMTAVPMTQLVMGREESDGIWVECFATVGVTNAVRAGEWPPSRQRVASSKQVGTINLIVITNACLSGSAMVGAVQVATESKTGVLRDHAVPCATGLSGATGTGTDAVVVAGARQGTGKRLRYSGTHTTIGAMIGLVVARCVTQGLARARRWNARGEDRLRKGAK